jgi:hypothetical protein
MSNDEIINNKDEVTGFIEKLKKMTLHPMLRCLLIVSKVKLVWRCGIKND